MWEWIVIVYFDLRCSDWQLTPPSHTAATFNIFGPNIQKEEHDGHDEDHEDPEDDDGGLTHHDDDDGHDEDDSVTHQAGW